MDVRFPYGILNSLQLAINIVTISNKPSQQNLHLRVREILNKVPTLIDYPTTYALVEHPTPRIH